MGCLILAKDQTDNHSHLPHQLKLVDLFSQLVIQAALQV